MELEGIEIKVGVVNMDATEELFRGIADAIKLYEDRIDGTKPLKAKPGGQERGIK